MLEITSAFGSLQMEGNGLTLSLLKKIVTMKGEVLEENTPYIEMEEKEEEEETSETPSSVLKKG